ncbi:SCO family protein [Stappia sp. F7233]|uniref:SCO family protein n=1 Tax=Stappia albiluteola TaxID=2758565 RepID=A0A839ABE6_9HYPH|nr:SCO family protein [Stappia albiluteola]MBA5776334.1 SCO family protein [Stappia albiluteola]
MSGLKIIRYGAWAAVAVLVFAIITISLGHFRSIDKDELISPVAGIGGPFELVDGASGQTVTDADFKGKPSAYFFGFTFCPDVCPTTLAEVQGWIDELGSDADKMNFAFVTVDPERDTPEVLRDYVSAFDKRIHPLSGSPEKIADMLMTYRVYSRKVTRPDGGYTMDHSAGVFLMDADNRFVGTIAYGEAHENAMAKLRRLIGKAGA